MSYQTDPRNCGQCGARCPGTSGCTYGYCNAACTSDGGCPAGTSCADRGGQTACLPTTCSATSEGDPCAVDAGSVAGGCCGSACVELTTTTNCGQCGRQCGFGAVCSSKICQTAASCSTARVNSVCAIDAGTAGTCCSGSCGALDFMSDPMNCGNCSVQCPVGYPCRSGSCVQPDGGYYVGCSVTCASGFSCQNSHCLRDSCLGASLGEQCNSAGSGQCCGGASCVDVSTSVTSCGQCGRACGGGQFCDHGVCSTTPTCGPSNDGVDCPVSGQLTGKCCGSVCVDVSTSGLSCGACNAGCPVGSTCSQGTCLGADAGSATCSAAAGGSCPPDTVCQASRCVPTRCAPGTSGSECGFGIAVSSASQARGKCCGGACVDLTQDLHNCGRCGTACAAGSICLVAGFIDPPTCVPPAPTSCTACGSGQFCLNGFCHSSSCQGPSGVCATSTGSLGVCGFSGQCVDAFTDPYNCGGLYVQCPPGQTCAGGVCQSGGATCQRGELGHFCALDAGLSNVCCQGSGCVDDLADPNNCASCGNRCNAGLSCLSGHCTATTCTPTTQGQTCAGDGGTPRCCASACVDLRADSTNCGACGRLCALGESCVSAQCGADTCSSANQGSPCHFDGGSSVTGGTCCSSACLDTRSDRNNCGACNRQCPGDAGCTSGVCQ